MRKVSLKKSAAIILSIACVAGSLIGCGSGSNSGSSAASNQTASKKITVVSREDGSGTRGAFIELFGIEEKDASGKKIDNTTEDANITNSTEVMMQTVAGNPAAIGYTSLGALNSSVKSFVKILSTPLIVVFS